MAAPDKKEDKSRDELFWLFPVLLVVAIIAITIIVRPRVPTRGDPSLNPGPNAVPLPAGAPHGQVSGYQVENIPVIIPPRDGTGIRTVEDLAEVLSKDLYKSEDEPVGEGTYVDSQVPGPGLNIVFRSDIEEPGNSDIYMVDELGYNPVRLTTWASVESFPAISSDGKRVYFASDRDDDPNNPNPFTKNTEIYMIDMTLFNENGSAEPTRLTYNNTTDYGISINADATKMVYMSATKENPDNPVMYLADGDAKNEIMIADTALHNCIPKISGDGRFVVYNSFFTNVMDIFLYDVEGNFHVNLTNSDLPDFFPAINYDGSVIVYEKLLRGSPQYEDFIELFRVNRDGTNEVQLTENRFADTFPALSDDGEWIVFVTKRWDFDGDNHYDEAMFYTDINCENLYKITKDPFYEEQPDVQ